MILYKIMKHKYEKAVIDLINQMFIIAGHDVKYEDIVNYNGPWYEQWSMTEEQYNEWLSWGEEYIRKNLKFSKKKAKAEMALVGLNWGLTFKK